MKIGSFYQSGRIIICLYFQTKVELCLCEQRVCTSTVFAVIEDVKVFLSECNEEVANEHLGFLLDTEDTIPKIAFLTDVFRHFNFLNLKLQGKGLLVFELLSETNVCTFPALSQFVTATMALT
ncbi:hypothetical protein [Candidatus Phytoplasma melaleucae]|uniref:Uncharacterized protein n=1 Tax=Candidatus Phytoplasma melaleucae TaxID=2982630 RepID=A0ABT9DE32_9MOLU|nr:hypothetical protein ['Melaleuca sp.' phytoplasma]MDO8168271.1 hypothetical protein ['Melaleuca sp.' phytoplasma]